MARQRALSHLEGETLCVSVLTSARLARAGWYVVLFKEPQGHRERRSYKVVIRVLMPAPVWKLVKELW